MNKQLVVYKKLSQTRGTNSERYISKEFDVRSEMRLPKLYNVRNATVFGTVLTALVQYLGRSIQINFPERGYNSAVVSNTLNYVAQFGSGGTPGIYTYGAVTKCKLKISMYNREPCPVVVGLIPCGPLQAIANNNANDRTSQYQSKVFLSPISVAGCNKTITLVIDLPKLARVPEAAYISSTNFWFSNGGAPGSAFFVYHQMYRTDTNAFTTGVDVTCDMEYDIQPVCINSQLAE